MRPYVICHMTLSMDGKVSGDFLYTKECVSANETYYEIHRSYKKEAQGFICGRVTMEGSFCGKKRPDLTLFQNSVVSREDFIANTDSTFFAIAFDSMGKLNWPKNKIIDEDPGYANATIIEVLSESVEDAYLAYLRSKNISYIFAGKKEINVSLALEKLASLFSIKTVLLEGGSILNGSFQKVNVIDELSLVIAPICAKAKDQSLFHQGNLDFYTLKNIKKYKDNVVWLNYEKRKEK